MNAETRRLVERVCDYPFFESVGRSVSGNVTRIGSWEAAAKESNSRKWEQCRLMARNALMRMVQTSNWNRFPEWNPLAEELRPIISKVVHERLEKVAISPDIAKRIGPSIAWDVMFICMEHHYQEVVHPLFHIPYIQPWYAAGHFPCGWDGPPFPDGWDGVIGTGRLKVF